MIKLEIKKDNIITDRVILNNQEEVDNFLEYRKSNSPFGLPERPELDENGEETGVTLPAEFDVIITEIILSYQELRLAEYIKRIDPKVPQAVTDKEMGDDSTMLDLIAEKAAIKLEFPKP